MQAAGISMCAAGIEVVGLLEQEARQQRNDQRRAQRVEGVAEGKDVGLLLYDVADRDIGAVAGVNAIDDAVAHEIVRELLDPGPGRLLEHRHRLRQHVGVILLALGQQRLQGGNADGAAELAHHVE